MERYALIIANPGEAGTDSYCEGVNKDVVSYKNFLSSPMGGYWLSSEIVTLIRPTALAAQAAMLKAKSADYALIIFAGHGYYSVNKKSTILVLQRGIELDSATLRDGSKKQTVILDCCRKKVISNFVEKSAAINFTEAYSNQLDPALCRRLFDKKINECSNDSILIHSCSIDEVANDDSEKGGLYSYNLLDQAKSWAASQLSTIDLSKHYNSRTVVSIHNLVSPKVKAQSGYKQNPQIEKPRSEPYFPFVIVA